ncbi:protein of unknown function DUF839 [Thermocrinis albus DSM 14484]|uniref:Uncharacterized protein n=1 Tax=Thermocrinis albus (strain DSM 14484 / JCM 11386 / HI 11/12) TaxID=638303 RepID=D3SMS9_THEAH|nr:PhoX family phosphatase [Thermocrinis albus]ADC90059.1 protein of unknown function DUF839 [Thermocrinis albus DSM 14484]
MEYIGDLIKRALLSRRDMLLAIPPFLIACGGGSSLTPSTVRFNSIKPNTLDDITVPDGFRWRMVIGWGDPLFRQEERINYQRLREGGTTTQDVEIQKRTFGYNNDFIGVIEHNNRYIMVVNHEYFNPELVFPPEHLGKPTYEEAMLMLEAHGLSVVELFRNSDFTFRPVVGSNYNRRITGSTRCLIEGPAKGHRYVGDSAEGTLNNCSAGKTPWGTVLTCEENFNSYFGGDINSVQETLVREIHQRYGVPSRFADVYGFYKYMDRFDVSKNPYESFKFGWVVEIDPLDPNRPPIKRTALGRFKHEAATCVVAPSGQVVVYMGDDERFQHLYKFVTKGKYDPINRENNMKLLDEGTLYVAKFYDNLTGEWVMLAEVSAGQIRVNPSLPSLYKQDPALVFIDTRGAATSLGATKMDRPEDAEWNPVTQSLWAVMTYNDRRTSPEPANPRPYNYMGHILEIIEQRNDPTATSFSWRIPLLCGIPQHPDPTKELLVYGQRVSTDTPPISAPDNITFDRFGNVWIATDGNEDDVRLRVNDGVYVLDIYERSLKMFLSGPRGCEICGPEFTSDNRTFLCAIQHPGEGGKGSWPHDAVVPRPSVICVVREDGTKI